jgi:hypothetical protein
LDKAKQAMFLFRLGNHAGGDRAFADKEKRRPRFRNRRRYRFDLNMR